MRSSNSGFQSIVTRLPLILTTLGALAGMLLIGTTIGQGEFIKIYLMLFAIASLAAVFMLGSKYWLLIPIAFSFNLPAIPFGGRAFELPSLAILGCVISFLCRFATNPSG